MPSAPGRPRDVISPPPLVSSAARCARGGATNPKLDALQTRDRQEFIFHEGQKGLRRKTPIYFRGNRAVGNDRRNDPPAAAALTNRCCHLLSGGKTSRINRCFSEDHQSPGFQIHAFHYGKYRIFCVTTYLPAQPSAPRTENNPSTTKPRFYFYPVKQCVPFNALKEEN